MSQISWISPCPHLIYPISLHSHLKEQLPVRSGISKTGSVVVFIQHSDMSGASCAARRRTPVLYDHNKLVAGLMLSVQGEAGADFTLSKRDGEKALAFITCNS